MYPRNYKQEAFELLQMAFGSAVVALIMFIPVIFA